ncbi:MAG TPA: RNase adapter RapZ, partial [Bacteroidales bacterium]|nr:RNase adapter RapZ [Bacteroidales bacterium]
MPGNQEINYLKKMFYKSLNEEVISTKLLPISGSNRKYYRLQTANYSVIGTVNEDIKENEAFVYLAKYFKSLNLPVPDIIDVSNDYKYYLQSDLGNTTLFSIIENNNFIFTDYIINLYQQALKYLLLFQTKTNSLDYSKAYPRPVFDKQSILWDLYYFKYYFLKLLNITFDEQKLEDDFQLFANILLQADNNFFMYRDFQSRNIMVNANQLWFIDFQGGRKGALQYDVASLLYDATANIPDSIRENLLSYYLNELEQISKTKKNEFLKYYNYFVVIRIMQALGAYGYRGLYQKKPHFIKSIPYALKNLQKIINCSEKEWEKIPYLYKILLKLFNKYPKDLAITENYNGKLFVSIHSFSYRKGIPNDYTGNGGGFVFDCRALPNPGRYDEYKELTGLNETIKKFFENKNEVNKFIANVKEIVMMSVLNYIERGFTNLQICFGCTGGKHRSVYVAYKIG